MLYPPIKHSGGSVPSSRHTAIQTEHNSYEYMSYGPSWPDFSRVYYENKMIKHNVFNVMTNDINV